MRKSRKDNVIAATIRLVAKKGAHSTTVRQIAREAGVTEAALYRHFDSKEDLIIKVYCRIVAEMAAVKEEIIESDKPIREKIREWIQVSYEYYDRYPDAFTYVLLTPHSFSDDQEEITTLQGRLLMKMFEQLPATAHNPSPQLNLSHFSGVLLNIPQLINTGFIEGPASKYVDEVVSVIERIFRLGD